MGLAPEAAGDGQAPEWAGPPAPTEGLDAEELEKLQKQFSRSRSWTGRDLSGRIADIVHGEAGPRAKRFRTHVALYNRIGNEQLHPAPS